MRTFVLTAVAALGLSLVVEPSSAAPQPPPVVKPLNASKAEHQRIVGYWTPQRMRDAVPGDALVAGRPKPRAEAGSAERQKGGGSGGGTAYTGYAGGVYVGGGEVVETTGKVFFTLKSTNYVCSGSSVVAGNKSLVLTAGHCVNEGPGAFVTNFAFVPAYDHGSRPFGTWTARSLASSAEWAGGGDLNHDIGFAVVSALNGNSLANVVGAQGIAFNQPRGRVMNAFGYPQAAPYDGTTLDWCWGTAINDPYGALDQGLKCNMTGGSSGGPWFLNFSTSTGIGTTNSLNSYKYNGGPYKGYMFGPYFGSVEQAVYSSASAQ
jgi:V8-like Glu-specific endopeptidase